MKAAIAFAAAGSLVGASTAGFGQPAPSGNTLLSAQRSIGRVSARQCAAGGNRVGTGFLWRDDSTIVTARHVVAGCSTVSVSFQSQGGRSYVARPVAELRAQDLVWLKLERATGLPTLREASGRPAVGSRVAAIGFPLGAPTMDSKLLDVTLANAPPGSVLQDMLTSDFANRLRQSGEIDLRTRIVRLDGNLLPGLSGAPLVDGNGLVVGIGSGGLQNGAGGLVWAVSVSYLGQYAGAPRISTVQPIASRSGLAFAFQQEQTSIERMECGALSLSLSREVPLADLFYMTDDLMGLQQIAASLGVTEQRMPQFRYAIWIDEHSGASIAVPAGADFHVEEDDCVADIDDNVRMIVRSGAVPPSSNAVVNQDVQRLSADFERDIQSEFDVQLFTDPSSTYFTPRARSDGFIVRRAGYQNNRFLDPNTVEADYAFVTHMARNDRYVGVAVIRRDFRLNPMNGQSCAFNPAGAPCQAAFETLRPWTRGGIAVHLATMPPQ